MKKRRAGWIYVIQEADSPSGAVALSDDELRAAFGELLRERDDVDRRMGIVSDEVRRRYVKEQKARPL